MIRRAATVRSASGPCMAIPTTYSVRTLLVALALVLVVPLVAALAFIVRVAIEHVENHLREAVATQAGALAREIDLQLIAARASLDTLTAARYIDEGNYAALHEAAERIVKAAPSRFNIVLFRADGPQVVNTVRPYGAALANAYVEESTRPASESGLRRTSAEWIRQVFASGQPAVSDLFHGALSDRPLTALHVPVTRHGKVQYVWSYSLSTEALNRMVAAYASGRGFEAVLIDRGGRIIASYPSHDKVVGAPVASGLIDPSKSGTQPYTVTTVRDGKPVLVAQMKTDGGWTVVMTAPRESINATAERSQTMWAIVGAITFFAFALVVVYALARSIAGPLRALSAAAAHVQEGRVPQVASQVTEIVQLRDALSAAASARQTTVRLALLDAVVAHAPDGVALFDHNLRFVQVNERAAAIDGIPIAAHYGKRPSELFGALGAEVESNMAKVIETGKPASIRDLSGELPALPGKRRWWSTEYFPLRDASGGVTHVGAVAMEITERKEAELAAQRAHAQTRYLVQNTPLAVIEWDGDLVVRVWNRRAEQMFGWSAEEAVGSALDALPIIDPEDHAKVARVIERLQQPATTYVFSANRNRTRDGSLLYCEWYNSVLHDETGRIVSVLSLVLDATERTAAEQRLVDADRRKDVYLATLAHELRNPLAPIRNAVAVLQRRGLATPEQVWARDIIDRQVTQMSRLLEDLLDVSRIAQGKLQLRLAPVSLADALQDGLETGKPMLEARRHTTRVELPPQAVWVEADRVRLAQVFANLLTNAAKYTEPGGVVTMRVGTHGRSAEVVVEDTGIGIEPQMLDRVFDAFSQSDLGAVHAQGGLGIGLALVKGLVELHGGRVSVQSEGAGKGARFTVSLPVIDAPGSVQKPAPPRRITLPAETRILVVDDNRDAADSLAEVLRGAGASVDVAYDGQAVLSRARRQSYQVGILDIGMPGMDGYALARELAKLPVKPYLIALTGWGQAADRAAALAAGFDEHRVKPVDPVELLASIGRLVSA